MLEASKANSDDSEDTSSDKAVWGDERPVINCTDPNRPFLYGFFDGPSWKTKGTKYFSWDESKETMKKPLSPEDVI